MPLYVPATQVASLYDIGKDYIQFQNMQSFGMHMPALNFSAALHKKYSIDDMHTVSFLILT